MSVKCQTWVWDYSETTGNDRIVLLFVADQADDDGTNSYPSIDRIADKTHLPKRTVMRCVERLERLGALVVHRPERRGRGHFNSYEVVMKGDTLTPIVEQEDCSSEGEHVVQKRRAKARKGAPPYVNGSRSLDPLTQTPDLNTRAVSEDAPPPDLRTGSEVQDQEHPSGTGARLLSAVAATAPACCRRELLDDPEQVAGRAALRRRLVLLAAELGEDAAVSIVAGEWPLQVASAMAHANARARAFLERPAAPASSRRASAPDPFDGMADASAAIAERARAREAELADEPRGGPPPAWKVQLLQRLHGTAADTAPDAAAAQP